VHIFWRNADDTALLNHFRILPHNRLDDLEIFHGDLFPSTPCLSIFSAPTYQRLHTILLLPAQDLALVQVRKRLKYFTPSADAHYISDARWSFCVLRILNPSHHLHFARLPQRNGIEEDIAVVFPDQCYRLFDLSLAERIERMWRVNLSCEV
jgi:hypothetical protein